MLGKRVHIIFSVLIVLVQFSSIYSHAQEDEPSGPNAPVSEGLRITDENEVAREPANSGEPSGASAYKVSQNYYPPAPPPPSAYPPRPQQQQAPAYRTRSGYSNQYAAQQPSDPRYPPPQITYIYAQPPPPPPRKPKLGKYGFSVSGILGMNIISSGNQNASGIGFGAHASYSLSPVWSLGVAGTFINSSPGDTGQSMGAVSSIALITATLDYYFPGLESLYMGARVGAGIRISSFNVPLAGNATTYSAAFGGLTGWNFQLNDALALRPQVGFIVVATPIATTDIQVELLIRYWPWH